MKKCFKDDLLFYILTVPICFFLSLLLIVHVIIIARGNIFTEKPPTFFGVSLIAVDAKAAANGGALLLVKNDRLNALAAGDRLAVQKDATTEILKITKRTSNQSTVLLEIDGAPFDLSEYQVIGKVVFHIPLVGGFYLFMKTTGGIFSAVAIPGGLAFFLLCLKRQRQAARAYRLMEMLDRKSTEK